MFIQLTSKWLKFELNSQYNIGLTKKGLPDFFTPKWERFGENLDFCQKKLFVVNILRFCNASMYFLSLNISA